MKRKTRCDSAQLTSYLYDELEPQQKAAVEEHLQGCEQCREELEKIRQLKSLVWCPEADQPVIRRIEAAVLDRVNRRRVRFAIPGLALGGSLVAILLLLTLKPDAPLPQPDETKTVLTQTEILEKIDMLENLDLLEAFDLLAEIEDLG
jgi:hypothetical protein